MKRRYREQMFENKFDESGTSSEEYYYAYKRVKRIKGFYIHLGVYCFVNLFLIINQLLDSETIATLFNWKTYGTALFWGIGLAAHGFSVFGKDIFFSQNWEENKIKELMGKDKNHKFE